MTRLRNVESGVVVIVSDDTACRLGPEWAPADSEPAKRSPGRPRKNSK